MKLDTEAMGRVAAPLLRLMLPLPIFLLCLAIPVFAQDRNAGNSGNVEADIRTAKGEITRLKNEIRNAESEVRKTDSLHRDEAARHAKLTENRTRDLKRRTDENEALETKIRNLASSIDAEKRKAAGLENAKDEILAVRKRLQAVLAEACLRLEGLVEVSLPWDREMRVERVRVLRKDIEAGSASLEEGFGRLKAILGEETKAGDEVAVFNRPMTRSNGEVVNAQVLKIGNQWLVYADEGEKHYGILERKASKGGKTVYEWKEEIGFADRAAIRLALDVKTAKKPPQLVELPMSIFLDSAETNQGGGN